MRYIRIDRSVRGYKRAAVLVESRTGRGSYAASAGQMVDERERVLEDRLAWFGLVFADCVGKSRVLDNLRQHRQGS